MLKWLPVLALSLFACGSETNDDASPLLISDTQLPFETDMNRVSEDMTTLDLGVPAIDLTDRITSACKTPIPFDGSRVIFEEVTAQWGLADVGAQGVRLTVADIDGDGWADLSVRRGGQRFDRFSPDPERQRRHHWLLKNNAGVFEDVTVSSGFSQMRAAYPEVLGRPAEVVTFGDVDNDGDLDVYTGIDTRAILELTDGMDSVIATIEERSELLLNDGNGHFEMTSADHPLRRLNRQDVPSGASFTDINRDGFLDLWITQGGLGAPMQDRLYLGSANGSFEDITRSAGLRTQNWVDPEVINAGLAHSAAWSATACDLNQDGQPDLLAGSYGRAPNHAWRAAHTDDDLIFANESVASGFAYDDNFSWQDNEFAACFCRDNPSAEACDEANSPRIACNQTNWRHNADREAFRLGGNTGTTICADFDNDGWQDLVTTEIRHWWAGSGSDGAELLLNQRSEMIRFERPGNETTGLAREHPPANWDEGFITASWLDFDNDGRKDLYLGGTDYAGNRGRLYHNQSQPGVPMFSELSTRSFFEHNRSHGVAIADFDRDGDQDIIVGHSRSRCDADAPHNCYQTAQIRAFANVLADSGNWLQLELEGSEGTNRSAIGAQVSVHTDTDTQLYEIGGGYGHFGAQDDLVVHIGLGDACEADVRIRWPNVNLSETRYRLPANHRFLVRQGDIPRRITSASP